MTSTAYTVAGRYRLVAELGRGGMGVVWEAFDELLHRAVAVKEVRFPPELPAADRDRLAGRTLTEARAVAALDTPAAVRVFDIVEQDGRPWLVMELVRGTTLSAHIASHGALPEPEVARVGLALVEALEAAHGAGVLHRDVKPSNVLLGDGRVALTDFGIATVEGDAGETTTGVLLGSPSYIAPERVRGERPSAASDWWALGATLWTALEGVQPYRGDSALAVLNAVAHDAPPEPSHGTAELRELLVRLLDPAPSSRPGAQEVAAVLRRSASAPAAVAAPTAVLPLEQHFDRTTVLASPAVASSPAAPPPRVPLRAPATARARRTGPLVAAAAAVVVAGGAVGIWLAQSGGDQRPRGTAGSDPSPRASTVPTSPRTSSAAPAPTTAAPSAPATGGGLQEVTGEGWRLRVPVGWTRADASGGTRYSDPAGGRHVLVAVRDPAGPSAVGAWEDQERSFRRSHGDYARLRLETIEADGASDAADWEFTYRDGGTQLHALDRAWVVDGVGYAVFVQSRAGDWDRSRPLYEQVLDSFRAA